MQKKVFTYRRLRFILIWMFVLGAPYIWFVPELLLSIKGMAYYVVNTILTIAVIFILWGMMDSLPGIKRKGYYVNENGTIIIEYNRKKVALDDVTELMLTDRHASSRGVTLLIRNNGEKIELLSEAIDKNTNIEGIIFYEIFCAILRENPQLKQEKDIFGEPIENWYKASGI